jgi:hypothetical protein
MGKKLRIFPTGASNSAHMYTVNARVKIFAPVSARACAVKITEIMNNGRANYVE